MNEPKLKRSIGLTTAILYGLGTILGAGIYVLVGKVADAAGMFTPRSFLLAATLTVFSALSYAELSARFPKSAGASLYVHKCFNKRRLTLVAGLLVILSGLISAGVLSRGFAGYMNVFLPLPDRIRFVGIIIILGLVALRGINLSSKLVNIMTLIEVAGLIIVIRVARNSFGDMVHNIDAIIPGTASIDPRVGILLGAFLAFFAFIGFENLVNNAEEIKKPQRNIPIAILTMVGLSTLLYIVIAIVTVYGLPLDQLQGSDAPLALLYETATGNPPVIITIISVFAIINGTLVQIIMVSRLLYGMSNEGRIPSLFGRVNEITRTPVIATWITMAVIIGMTFLLSLADLANLTSLVVILVFSLINLGLIRLKMQKKTPAAGFHVPLRVPAIGLLINIFFIVYKGIDLL